ncbi:MAG TPA: hypothetical protein VE685_09110 [Thermoanaerobaculia bacterium]|nr:hypothetical protein [Thermoanaerobaculia bacterium]
MGTGLSVDRILASLEEQRAFHKERETFHAAQAELHREQQALHAAEYERVTQHYEAFKASAGAAAELAARALPAEPEPSAPEKPREEEALPPRMPRSRLVEKVVAELPARMEFGPAWLAQEINRRFGRQLPRPVSSRLVSNHLRQMAARGRLQIARRGTAHREAWYRSV